MLLVLESVILLPLTYTGSGFVTVEVCLYMVGTTLVAAFVTFLVPPFLTILIVGIFSCTNFFLLVKI